MADDDYLRVEHVRNVAMWVRTVARAYAQQIQPVYALLDWKWANEDETEEVPSARAIEEAIRELADGLPDRFPGKRYEWEFGSGGIVVWAETEPGGPVKGGVRFEHSLVCHEVCSK